MLVPDLQAATVAGVVDVSYDSAVVVCDFIPLGLPSLGQVSRGRNGDQQRGEDDRDSGHARWYGRPGAAIPSPECSLTSGDLADPFPM